MSDKPEKVFLSCIDSNIDVEAADALSQPIQHLAISTYAKSVGGTIRFYTAEDALTRASQSLMRSTLMKRPQIDGVIFFRLKQFLYGDDFNFDFLRSILDWGYEVHFAREVVSVGSVTELYEKYAEFYCFAAIARARGLPLPAVS